MPPLAPSPSGLADRHFWKDRQRAGGQAEPSASRVAAEDFSPRRKSWEAGERTHPRFPSPFHTSQSRRDERSAAAYTRAYAPAFLRPDGAGKYTTPDRRYVAAPPPTTCVVG